MRETPLTTKCPIPLPSPGSTHSTSVHWSASGRVIPKGSWLNLSQPWPWLPRLEATMRPERQCEQKAQGLCTARKWGPGFPNFHCWTSYSCKWLWILVAGVGITFIYLPCILLVFAGENPLSHVLPPFPLCEEGWEGWALIFPCGYFFSFFFLGENSGMLPPFRSRGRVTGKPVHYLPIVPFTQCSCPFGLEGNLGNSALCAPMASHPSGFSVNPRWVSRTDLAPPRTSCLCRSFARVLGYCLQASGLKAESKKCLSD